MLSLVELALAERDYKNAGVSFFSFFLSVGTRLGGGVFPSVDVPLDGVAFSRLD